MYFRLNEYLVQMAVSSLHGVGTFDERCDLCEDFGIYKRRGISDEVINHAKSASIVEGENYNMKRKRRYVDQSTFHGHPKTKSELWARNFRVEQSKNFDQSSSLIKLINKIAVEYLSKCSPFIFYDTFVEDSESFILQNLFHTFPLSFYHAKIDKDYKLSNSLVNTWNGEQNCRSYILFLSDPLMTRKIIGPQLENRVVVVARSTQWKLRDFLASEESSNLVNLLVIKESLSADLTKERPYVLYTHKLYSDGLGSNVPIVLTSWVRGALTRPHINLFPEKLKDGFAGHRFLVAAVDQPPFIFKKKSLDYASGNVNIDWEGLEYQIIKILSQRLNFSYEIAEPSNIALLGSGEAIREEVQHRKADIGMSGAYITADRVVIIDMSVGHSKDCAAFITLASKALPKWRAILGPFQWQVWVALTAVYLLGIFPLAFTDQLSIKHLIGNYGEMENMFWYVFGTFTNSLTFSGKYSWSNSAKLSTRLLIGFYWMFTIIITACYTGSIIAFVTLPKFPDTADSVSDLLGLFYRVGTLGKGGWERWFLNSSHEPTERLFKKMEFVDTLDEGIGNVTHAFFWNYAFLGSQSQLEYLVQSNFTDDVSLSRHTALHLSDECFAPFQVGFAYPKHSVYRKSIDKLILRLQQGGLVKKILSDVVWNMRRTSGAKLLQASSGVSLREMVQEERQLTTADTEGMFILMAVGYLFAAVTLISEIIGGFTNKCRLVMQKRKGSSAFSSRRASADLQDLDELHKHNERKVQRQQEYKKTQGRFFNFAEINQSIREMYGDRKDNIMQSQKFFTADDVKAMMADINDERERQNTYTRNQVSNWVEETSRISSQPINDNGDIMVLPEVEELSDEIINIPQENSSSEIEDCFGYDPIKGLFLNKEVGAFSEYNLKQRNSHPMQ
ncbi:ionotropic receptor 21a [Condylostylus longicornis]|uniref:ionotropic receptor 21a n=1 Tax=Condylostylus longicornis TaxID=2530218 RepID=UPI00244E36AE|nr:ionotropic receptor 21a [Condylostylus longicornis]